MASFVNDDVNAATVMIGAHRAALRPSLSGVSGASVMTLASCLSRWQADRWQAVSAWGKS